MKDFSSSRQWTGNNESAILYNDETGQIHALIMHDGFGKYHPTLYVGPLAALRLWLEDRLVIISVSLKPFPQVALEYVRLKCADMREAAHMIQQYCDAHHVL